MANSSASAAGSAMASEKPQAGLPAPACAAVADGPVDRAQAEADRAPGGVRPQRHGDAQQRQGRVGVALVQVAGDARRLDDDGGDQGRRGHAHGGARDQPGQQGLHRGGPSVRPGRPATAVAGARPSGRTTRARPPPAVSWAASRPKRAASRAAPSRKSDGPAPASSGAARAARAKRRRSEATPSSTSPTTASKVLTRSSRSGRAAVRELGGQCAAAGAVAEVARAQGGEHRSGLGGGQGQLGAEQEAGPGGAVGQRRHALAAALDERRAAGQEERHVGAEASPPLRPDPPAAAPGPRRRRPGAGRRRRRTSRRRARRPPAAACGS